MDELNLARCLRLKSDKSNPSSLFIPIEVKVANNPDDINVGEEITGRSLKKEDIIKLLNDFLRRQPLRQLALNNGIDNSLFQKVFKSFRDYCSGSKILPPELHIKISDILHGHGHVDDLYPDFLKHAREIFPHLECMEELKKISDLSSPLNWYSEARSIHRKIIYHCGPTNSGKTYHALKRFMEADSGIYCAPLKLLAVEVNTKSNEAGTKCDLITGEERLFANEDGSPSSHVACTIEMASVSTPYDVAIIDEVQMVRDTSRGWAWTRALLGLAAKEIHLCGEEAALDIIKRILSPISEDVEVRRYNRLTPLVIQDGALNSLDHVKKGDCIVCFSKKDIFSLSLELDSRGHEVAVIYGSLPPGTKVLQTKRFNDPQDPCDILVATDAIGMGLNLNIKRIIFYSLLRPEVNENGEKKNELISTSTALQIAGRAGRFSTKHNTGYVTTFKSEDLPKLKQIMSQSVDPIEAVGLHPTMEQIEMFAYNLPKATLSNLIEIFISLCKVDRNYFICNVDNLIYLASLIEHVPLPLRVRYVFCCAPINRQVPFICTMFLKFARQYSQNEPITADWMFKHIETQFKPPQNIAQLVHLEAIFDVFDLYLWLSYRFSDLFPDAAIIRDMQKELDEVIHSGVKRVIKLLKNNEEAKTTRTKSKKEKTRESEDETLQVINAQIENDLKASGSLDILKEGSMTEQLLNSGVLTPKILSQLHKEWKKSEMKK
ncbi:ATP-dependent RNA helicase SUV3-like protein, partial [Dinothrombium tinctorium]